MAENSSEQALVRWINDRIHELELSDPTVCRLALVRWDKVRKAIRGIDGDKLYQIGEAVEMAFDSLSREPPDYIVAQAMLSGCLHLLKRKPYDV
jgi:hypothetical protein